jgi:hypothetical protein
LCRIESSSIKEQEKITPQNPGLADDKSKPMPTCGFLIVVIKLYHETLAPYLVYKCHTPMSLR